MPTRVRCGRTAAAATSTASAAAAPAAPQRIGGDVAQANLISSPKPEYPALARAARVQGVVLLNATIGKDGTIKDLKVISGHPLLNEAAHGGCEAVAV